MILCSVLVLVFAFVHVAAAHYCFPYFMFNETMSPRWKYVRQSLTNDTASKVGTGSFPPMYDLKSENIRCGRNSTGTGNLSQVAVVEAGSKVGFRPDLYPTQFCSNCARTQIPYFHDGPLFAYLSFSLEQSEKGLQKWDGDGGLSKVAERGPDDARGWWYNTMQDNTMQDNTALFSTWNFTIPKATPPGYYLLRVESIYPQSTLDTAQFYASCAQVKIVGNGNGDVKPGPVVKFPGAFDSYDPGVLIPANLSGHWAEYQIPGPKLWTG